MKEKSTPKNGESTSENFKKVFVGNLNFSTNWQKLKDYMKKAGNVLFADVFMDHKGRSKGCGLVEFSEHEEALKAISSLNDTKLDGRYIYIREDNLNLAKKSDPSRFERSRDRSRDRRSRDKRNKSEEDSESSREKKKSKKKEKNKKKKHSRSRSKSKSESKSKSRSRSKSKRREKEKEKDKDKDKEKDKEKEKEREREKEKEKEREREKEKERERERERDREREKSKKNKKEKDREKEKEKSKSHSKSRSKSPSSKSHSKTPSRSRSRSNNQKSNEKSKSKSKSKERSNSSNEKGCEITVKNLPSSLNWQNLKDAFQGFGKVKKAEVELDESGKSIGQGYVIFERKKDALVAIENMHHAMFNGKELSVKLAKN